MLNKLKSQNGREWLFFYFFVFLFILLRVVWYYTFYPMVGGDSGGYLTPAALVFTGHLTGGGRTPCYPFFLGILEYFFAGKLYFAENIPEIVGRIISIFQFYISIFSAVYFLKIVYEFLRERKIIFILCFFLVLNPQISLFDNYILTESLSNSLFLLFVAMTIKDYFLVANASKRDTFLQGLVGAAAILTRPNLLITILVFLIGFLVFLGKNRGEKKKIFFNFLGIILPVFAWMSFNFIHSGNFTLTALTGYEKTHTVYNLWDYADDKDVVLKNIMLKYYHRLEASNQVRADYIWDAVGELRDNLDKMPFKKKTPAYDGTQGLGDYLGQVSDRIIFSHPIMVTKNIFHTFADVVMVSTSSFNVPFANGTDPRALGDHKTTAKNKWLYDFYTFSQYWHLKMAHGFYILILFLSPISILFFIFRRKPIDKAHALIIGSGASIVVSTFFICLFNTPSTRYFFQLWVLCAIYITAWFVNSATKTTPLEK